MIMLKAKQEGMVAIVVVTMVIIILSLTTLGFSKIMDRGFRQAIDRELASGANYAAESGINDARHYVADHIADNTLDSIDTAGSCLQNLDNDLTRPPQFIKKGSLSGDYNGPTSTDELIKYTCVMINTKPKEITYPINAGETKLFKVYADTASLNKLYFSWTNANTCDDISATSCNPQPLPNYPKFPKESDLSADQTGVLKANIYRVPQDINSSSDVNATLTSLARSYILFPNAGATGGASAAVATVDYAATNGNVIKGNCHKDNLTQDPTIFGYKQSKPRYCNAGVVNLPGPPTVPTVTVTADNTNLTKNAAGTASTNIRWSVTGATSCNASADPANSGWTGSEDVGINKQTPVTLTTSTNFYLSCTGPGGSRNGYVTVNTTAMAATSTVRGGDFIVCNPRGDPDGDNNPPGVACSRTGSSVYNTNDYEASYTTFDKLPSGQYKVSINYGNAIINGYGTPPCGIYNFNVGLYFTVFHTSRHIDNWQLPPCGNTLEYPTTIGLPDSLSRATGPTLFAFWNNNQWVDDGAGTRYDPNFRIDTITLTQVVTADVAPALNPPATTADPADTSFYYVQLTALYKDLDVSIQGADASNAALSLKGAQTTIDVTAQGNDVLKRLKSTVDIDNQYSLPSFAVQSMDTICKKVRLPKIGASSFGDSYIDDSPANNSDSACKL